MRTHPSTQRHRQAARTQRPGLTITPARDQQQKGKAPKGEKSLNDTQSAKHNLPQSPFGGGCGGQTNGYRLCLWQAETVRPQFVRRRARRENELPHATKTQQVTRRWQQHTRTKRVKDSVFNKLNKNPARHPNTFCAALQTRLMG